MQYYRYRDNITKQIQYVNSAGIPSSSNIIPNSLTYIKETESSSSGSGVLTYFINLSGNTYSNINNSLPIGSYTISIKKEISMDEAPSGIFNISKISSLVDANINEFNNVQSIISNEKLHLQWLNGNFLQLKKDTNPSTINNTFNGNYIVNIM